MIVLVVIVLFVMLLVGVVVSFVHPAGTAMMLLAITPFDAIPWMYFRHWGNLITFVPVFILLIVVRPSRWPHVFMGTRIQQAGAALLLALLTAHVLAVSVLGYAVFETYARKLTLLILTGLFAYCFHEPKNVYVLVRVLVVSMAIFMLMSASDFYLGIQLLPISVGEYGDEGALSVEFERYLGSSLRFRAAGLPVNRTANWTIVPFFLALGWGVKAKRIRDRWVAGFCAIVVLSALLATVSRSSMFGVFVGTLLLIPMAFRINFASVLAGGIAALVIGGTAYQITQFTGVSQNIETRMDEGSLPNAIKGRISRTLVGVEMWAQNPILGVGVGAFKKHSDSMLTARGDSGGRGAHNSYTETLAETGLLGFVPFMLLLTMVFRQFLISVKRDFPEVDFWRPYFFAGFVGNLAGILFNVYHWERYFWVTISFAVVLERYSAMSARKRRAEYVEAIQARDDSMRLEVPALGSTASR